MQPAFHSLLFCNLLSIPKKSTRICIVQCSHRGASPPLKSIRRFRKKHSRASEVRSHIGGTGRSFPLEVASFALTKKNSEPPEVLRARFFARLGHFGAQTCSPEPPRDAPGLDFRVRNNSFFEVFPFDGHSTRQTSNIEKTL